MNPIFKVLLVYTLIFYGYLIVTKNNIDYTIFTTFDPQIGLRYRVIDTETIEKYKSNYEYVDLVHHGEEYTLYHAVTNLLGLLKFQNFQCYDFRITCQDDHYLWCDQDVTKRFIPCYMLKNSDIYQLGIPCQWKDITDWDLDLEGSIHDFFSKYYNSSDQEIGPIRDKP